MEGLQGKAHMSICVQDKQHDTPYMEYSIFEEDWMYFRACREFENWQVFL